MSLISMLEQRAAIERASAAIGPAGEVSFVWSQVQGDVPCSMQPLSVEMAQLDAGARLKEKAMVYLPAEIDLRPNQENSVGDRLLIDSVYWLVVSVASDQAGRKKFTSAAVTRM